MAAPSFLSSEQYSEYRQRLAESLNSMRTPEAKITEIIAYSDILQQHKVPIIFDQPHLAGLLGYDLDYVQVLSTCKEDFYKEYKIAKRNGKMRVIHEPLPNLKEIQTWILNNILMSPGVLNDVLPVVTAFMPHRDIRDNARPHVGKRTVICMDLKDFFTSVRWIQVYAVFADLGYGKDVAGMLAHLCTLDGSLPQGAPTSPMLSNLVMKRLDKKIYAFCHSKGIAYTRYADDLTFSSMRRFEYGQLMGYVEMVMRNEKFTINNEKTKVFHQNQSQNVTGIVVNEYQQVGKKYRKKIRQEMYYLLRYGLTGHYPHTHYPFSEQSYLSHLLGKVNHVLHVNGDDQEMVEYRQKLREIIRWKINHQ